MNYISEMKIKEEIEISSYKKRIKDSIYEIVDKEIKSILQKNDSFHIKGFIKGIYLKRHYKPVNTIEINILLNMDQIPFKERNKVLMQLDHLFVDKNSIGNKKLRQRYIDFAIGDIPNVKDSLRKELEKIFNKVHGSFEIDIKISSSSKSNRKIKFYQLSQKRLEKLIIMMDQLGKLSNKKNYSYDQNDWDDIQSELITSIIILFEKFDKKNGTRELAKRLEIYHKMKNAIAERR